MPTLVSKLYDLSTEFHLNARDTDRLTRHVARHWKQAGKRIGTDPQKAADSLYGLVGDVMGATGWDVPTTARFVGLATAVRAGFALPYIDLAEANEAQVSSSTMKVVSPSVTE